MVLYDGVQDFISSVKQTKEFNELVQEKNYIEKKPLLKNEVLEFNKKLAAIYSSNKSTNVIEAKVTELNKQFGSLSKNPEVDRFIKASKSFNDMMVKVYKSINDSIESELKLR